MSETSIHLRSQGSLLETSVDSIGVPITPRGFSQAENYVKNKPKFAEFMCSHVEVGLHRHLVFLPSMTLHRSFAMSLLSRKQLFQESFGAVQRT
jgi:hypothetical protein